MIKRKTRHGIFFLTVLSIIIWLLPKSSSDPVSEPPARLDTSLNFSLRDFNAKLLDKQGEVQPERIALWTEHLRTFDRDVLIVGHTHQVFAERIGTTLVVNPGSSAFNHSCAILRLPEMTVEVFPLSDKAVVKNWIWSDHVMKRG